MRLLRRRFVLILVVLLGLQGPLVSGAAEVEFIKIPDEDYERAEKYMLIESYLQEIGLSMEDILETNIDLTQINTEDYTGFDYENISLDNSLENGSNMFIQSKRFATELYGPDASNLEFIKTFLLYYVDVHEGDFNAGLVWDRLPARYYPKYMTDEDDRVYNIVIDRLGDGILLEMFGNVAQAAISIPNLLNIEELTKKTGNIESNFKKIKELVDIVDFTDIIIEGKDSRDSFKNISDPEGFMTEIASIIDEEESFSELEKELLKNYTISILSSTFTVLAGMPSVGVTSIVGMYTSSMFILTSTIYDQAIMNSLAYTRNTRLGLRFANSIGMYQEKLQEINNQYNEKLTPLVREF